MSIKMSESIANLAKAYAQFQAEVKNPNNTAKNPQFKSKYAPLDEVINTAKPVLAKYGLSVLQSTGSEGESVVITSLLLHESGEFIQSSELTLPAYQIKGGGVKDFNAQGAGSAITYGRRYSLSALLGLSSEDDDDGNVASGGYRDSSNNAPKSNTNTGGGLSDEEKEKRRQEAIKKAQERSNANTPPANDTPTTNSPAEDTTDSSSDDKISPQQEKAINNLLNVLSRKKGAEFDKDSFLTTVISEYGVDKLDNITSDQAKEVITKINKEMRS
jgi:hypothetical protein